MNKINIKDYDVLKSAKNKTSVSCEKKLYKNKDWLNQKYINEKLSTYKIAKLIKVAPTTIWKWIKIFNIKMRSKAEFRIGKPLSKEIRNKISRTNSGKNNPFFGKHHTKESKEKKRQAMKKWHKNHPNIQRGRNNPNFGKRGKDWPNWAGEKTIQNNYVYVYKPEHPYSNEYGRIAEHRLVAEKALGRYLKPNEIPHHINRIKDDNQNCNLLICTKGYHQWLHRKMEYLKNGKYAFEK